MYNSYVRFLDTLETNESPTRTIGDCSIWYFRGFDSFRTNENTLHYITYSIHNACSYKCIERLIDLGLSGCIEIQKQYSIRRGIILSSPRNHRLRI